jgi:hypothetical protein
VKAFCYLRGLGQAALVTLKITRLFNHNSPFRFGKKSGNLNKELKMSLRAVGGRFLGSML